MMSSTITMQGFTIAAITATEKHTLKLDSMLNHDKVTQTVRNLGQGHRVIVRA